MTITYLDNIEHGVKPVPYFNPMYEKGARWMRWSMQGTTVQYWSEKWVSDCDQYIQQEYYNTFDVEDTP